MLLDYFGEKKADKCGSCDYCSGRYEKPNAEELKTIKQSIKISLLKKQMDLKELLSQYSTSLDLKVVFVVQHLSNQGFIKKNEKNQLHWID
jgi:superfamily II DNA helicase RecQ